MYTFPYLSVVLVVIYNMVIMLCIMGMASFFFFANRGCYSCMEYFGNIRHNYIPNKPESICDMYVSDIMSTCH